MQQAKSASKSPSLINEVLNKRKPAKPSTPFHEVNMQENLSVKAVNPYSVIEMSKLLNQGDKRGK